MHAVMKILPGEVGPLVLAPMLQQPVSIQRETQEAGLTSQYSALATI